MKDKTKTINVINNLLSITFSKEVEDDLKFIHKMSEKEIEIEIVKLAIRLSEPKLVW